MADTNTLKDLLYPAIIAIGASLASYLATRNLQKSSLDNERFIRRADLVDRLLLNFDKLVSILQRLQEDVENLPYFSLRNIQIGIVAVNDLKLLANDVVLIKDTDMRKDITSTIDVASALLEEMNIMENWLVNQETDMKNKVAETLKEYRMHQTALLREGYYFDQDGKVKQIKKGNRGKEIAHTDQKAKVFEEIYKGLNMDIDRTGLDNLIKENEKKRQLLAVRLLDIQTRLSQLKVRLQS